MTRHKRDDIQEQIDKPLKGLGGRHRDFWLSKIIGEQCK